MINNSLTYDNCPLCCSSSISKKGDISYAEPLYFSTTIIELDNTPELWKCSKCQSSFTQNRVSENDSIKLYSNGLSAERWSRTGITFVNSKPENQLKCLQQYFLPGKKVLDIGCNTGELLDYAKSLGCETTGVEYSKQSREVIKTKNHKSYSTIPEINEQFDVITAFDLVEHLYDMPTFFLNCKKLLKNGGLLIILTGNIDSFSAKFCNSKWWYVRFPEHISFPSHNYFVKHSGFTLVEKVKTYASIGYEVRLLSSLKGVMIGILRGRYSGLPSIRSDHMLVILRNGI